MHYVGNITTDKTKRQKQCFPDVRASSKTGSSKQCKMLRQETNTSFPSLRVKFDISSEYISLGIYFQADAKEGCLASATSGCSPSS